MGAEEGERESEEAIEWNINTNIEERTRISRSFIFWNGWAMKFMHMRLIYEIYLVHFSPLIECIPLM